MCDVACEARDVWVEVGWGEQCQDVQMWHHIGQREAVVLLESGLAPPSPYLQQCSAEHYFKRKTSLSVSFVLFSST